MEVPFNLGAFVSSSNVADVLATTNKPLVVKLENKKLHWASRMRQRPQWVALQHAVDRLGEMSAEVQCLKRPVTSFGRFADASDEQALYLFWELKDTTTVNGGTTNEGTGSAETPSSSGTSVLLGYLKIVRDRCLYLVNEEGKSYVNTPTCLLDFYTHESIQHEGEGCDVALFNVMLQAEKTTAKKCAYDKPSAVFLQFLDRHYGLQSPIWQPTAIVVFPPFFDGLQAEKQSAGRERSEKAEGICDDDGRPLTAVERNRRSINQSYNGTTPPRVGTAAARAAGNASQHSTQYDRAGEIIHGTGPVSRHNPAPPDTPQGMKVSRDYGHQRIW